MDKDKAQVIGAAITTGVSVAANMGFGLAPDALVMLNSCAPLIQLSFERLLSLFCKKDLVSVEQARLSISVTEAIKTVKSNEENGKALNRDFFSDYYSKTDEIIEATVRAAINDAQNIKSIHYGRLIGNVLFQHKYDESSIFMLLNIATQLSYDELCFLSVIENLPGHCYERIVNKANDDIKAQEFLQYLLHFKGLGLVLRVPPFVLGATLDSLVISTLGQDLVAFLDLGSLSREDCESMSNLLKMYIGI